MNNTAPPQLLFAIIGCGVIGRKRVTALGKIPGTKLCHACDLDVARAADLAKLTPDCKATTDLSAVLADPDVQAVIVSTLNASLAPITLAAVRTGKHVLVEKPGVFQTSQVREIRAAAARTSVRVRLGCNHRFHPALQKWGRPRRRPLNIRTMTIHGVKRHMPLSTTFTSAANRHQDCAKASTRWKSLKPFIKKAAIL